VGGYWRSDPLYLVTLLTLPKSGHSALRSSIPIIKQALTDFASSQKKTPMPFRYSWQLWNSISNVYCNAGLWYWRCMHEQRAMYLQQRLVRRRLRLKNLGSNSFRKPCISSERYIVNHIRVQRGSLCWGTLWNGHLISIADGYLPKHHFIADRLVCWAKWIRLCYCNQTIELPSNQQWSIPLTF